MERTITRIKNLKARRKLSLPASPNPNGIGGGGGGGSASSSPNHRGGHPGHGGHVPACRAESLSISPSLNNNQSNPKGHHNGHPHPHPHPHAHAHRTASERYRKVQWSPELASPKRRSSTMVNSGGGAVNGISRHHPMQVLRHSSCASASASAPASHQQSSQQASSSSSSSANGLAPTSNGKLIAGRGSEGFFWKREEETLLRLNDLPIRVAFFERITRTLWYLLLTACNCAPRTVQQHRGKKSGKVEDGKFMQMRQKTEEGLRIGARTARKDRGTASFLFLTMCSTCVRGIAVCAHAKNEKYSSLLLPCKGGTSPLGLSEREGGE